MISSIRLSPTEYNGQGGVTIWHTDAPVQQYKIPMNRKMQAIREHTELAEESGLVLLKLDTNTYWWVTPDPPEN